MTLQELKEKRGFEVSKSFTNDLHLNFKSSNKNIAYEVMALFNSLGLECKDICGGKAVGGYYVSTFIDPIRAENLQLNNRNYL